MKYLLDTHILLWWLGNDKRLSTEFRGIIADPENIVHVSSVSVWEIAIKSEIGKLKIPDKLEETLIEHDFLPLAINFRHALLAGQLPMLHHDPFDRMLLAQASIEELTLLTDDKLLKQYDIH